MICIHPHLFLSRYECYDGCDLGLLRCQPGYHCDWPSTTGVPAESNWDKCVSSWRRQHAR